MFKQVLLFIFAVLVIIINIKGEITNNEVVRVIDIQSQFVKIDAVISIQNRGLSSINQFIYTLDPDVRDFYIAFKNSENAELLHEQVTVNLNDKNHTCQFHVHLDKPIAANERYKVKMRLVYINKIVPLYKTLPFVEDQFVSYSGNLMFYSPYKTFLLQTTYVWNKTEDSRLSHPPHYETNTTLVYFHQAVEPYSFEKINIDFKNNNPFLVVTSLERIIDVSHFGKIYVEDIINIKNEGSKLVGPFERKQNDLEVKASRWWYTYLPASAEDIHYFDSIGNSSKSALVECEEHKTFKFLPRYPLLSGWKTAYAIKYSVPTFEYLYHHFNAYFVLKMRAVDHVLNDVVIRKALVKVLLPETALIGKVGVPYGFTRLDNENHCTNLCIFGRPTVTLNASNILENHIADFTVEYTFHTGYLLRAPLVVVLYLESIFVFFIFVFHI